MENKSMSDLLVPLFSLPPIPTTPSGVAIRKVFSAELPHLLAWIEEAFSTSWAAEVNRAAGLPNIAVFIAVKGAEIVGFSCYDSAARGVFGPTGVCKKERGNKIGEALLLATLHDMKSVGYAYGVIGAAGPVEYYKTRVGAQIIEGGSPGFLECLTKPNKCKSKL